MEFKVILHEFGFVPVHAPLQLLKTEPPEGAAVSETDVPGRLSDEQVPPVSVHEIEPSLAGTDPVPPPVIVTFSVMPSAKVADADSVLHLIGY